MKKGTPALSGKELPSRGKVFRDPVLNLFVLHPQDKYLLDLIDCAEFQRLRRIKQLGVSSITYPGAEHTRFAHSIGVCGLAARILERLAERYQPHKKIVDLIRGHEREVKAAALLHDIGHGPFSHMIERVFATTAEHEKRTVELISDEESEVNQCLQHHDIKPAAVRSIIDGTFPIQFLRDIVSSQLDADRMDYLVRDSLMTGVKYGHCDPEWLIYSMCLGLDPVGGVENEPNNLRLCLDDARGLHAAEQLIIARMHMSFQVYYHRVTRSWEANLLCLFNWAKRLISERELPKDTPEITKRFFAQKGKLSLRDFRTFDETAMYLSFHIWAGAKAAKHKALAELSSAFLTRRKRFFAHEFTEKPVENSYKMVIELQAKGAKDGFDFYHDEVNFRGYKDFGRSITKGKSSEESEETVTSEAIFLANGDLSKRAKPVEHDPRALITPALSTRPPHPLNRVFVHEKFYPMGK